MKIVSLIFTRNEGELLHENIEFHIKQGVDLFLIMDSASNDDTVKVMQKFEKQGIARCFYDNKIFKQKEQIDRLARIAFRENKPDWLILSDTDEFWFYPKGLKAYFSCVPKEINTLKIKRYQYFPTEKDNSRKQLVHRRMLFRENGQGIGFDTGLGHYEEGIARSKIAFRPVHRDIDIMPGNHTVHFPGRRVLKVPKKECIIREYPFRDYRQFEDKVKRAEVIFRKNQLYKGNKKLGTHWHAFLQTLRQGKLEKFYKNSIFFDKYHLQKALTARVLVRDETLAKW
ncbi:glycosyltransferase family 2 protein [Patescibacteria group bacterium]|nr:glycosyltransferase family 2 protein [Patescibacteria group bacterium]MBU1074729.1 glycosyltransferase family 2 protein [Patescibacteria group bacterium]MBU1951754.1 glycosyltransferase family 2 protein [Patescibacteria group bacterium]